jgi:Tfp pilus tip-associated adhesin PilY1
MNIVSGIDGFARQFYSDPTRIINNYTNRRVASASSRGFVQDTLRMLQASAGPSPNISSTSIRSLETVSLTPTPRSVVRAVPRTAARIAASAGPIARLAVASAPFVAIALGAIAVASTIAYVVLAIQGRLHQAGHKVTQSEAVSERLDEVSQSLYQGDYFHQPMHEFHDPSVSGVLRRMQLSYLVRK